MRRAASAFFITTSLALSTLTFAPLASAQDAQPAATAEDENVSDADKARAASLFDEARQLMAEGKVALACDRFSQSNKVRPGIGTLYNLADCSEKLGKTGTAYKLFAEVADRTSAALQSEREQKARERMASLEKRIVKIRISIPTGAYTKVRSVKIDGEIIAPDQYNKDIICDPGDHTVTAQTVNDAGEPYEEEVDLDDEGKIVTVAIPVKPGKKMKRRVGMIVGGGVTAVVGLGAIGGAVYFGGQSGDEGIAIGLGVLGVVALGVGIPIFAVGFKKKPVRDGSIDDLPLLIEPSPIPDVALTPTSGSLTWHF
ncbi:MAG: hypothetical protein U0271_32575 [Polyangiaceae bacterium]